MPQNDDSSLMGFFVSRTARDYYQFDRTLFGVRGKSVIANFHSARVFAQQMNRKRDLVNFPEQAIHANDINAMAWIHGITQYVFRNYCDQHGPQFLRSVLDRLYQQFGSGPMDDTLLKFIDEFPPTPAYLREMSATDYLAGMTGSKSNREILLEELLMLWLSNANPAFSPFFELLGDGALAQQTSYPRVMTSLYRLFGETAERDAADNVHIIGGINIIDFLLAPVRASPHSLEGQLAILLERWGGLIGSYAYGLLRSLDLIKEEHKPTFSGGPGPAVVPVYDLTSLQVEFEKFTPDREWMPKVVLLAKNAYVWLDQLSKKYGQSIVSLDQIPDVELDTLASWGINGLWLIGLWERSSSSQTIKQLCGNPEAVASAYSLLDYQIADALGGEPACQNLRQRAWRRGIRLASDMVPNHVGIDGKWVMEHPDWFISLPYSPFPSYSFNGPDLSPDARVEVYIEDHYYNRSDAAVVFKRVDRHTGNTVYIYHGNDGTSMPWNDTAQLNYLNPEMREAMIQTILHVARQFPIIRFDAAMTLVKKHFHRLWFPEPGSGGAIPSRAEHGMSKAQFDALMPQEFWRELVDRAAVEAPDTLLLAEAFWLMEGYFVRTLGMHRVYNSAFMNMLRDEDNANYRLVMKNTLEFDPEVLKRFVNFMNNPDERTAVDQFGKDDKYFGCCTIMITMPGLPMLGHGQVEGFNEKYGMEYRKAYWDEQPDGFLIQRHEREIFPLVRKRYLFADVEQFLLYDMTTPEGEVNEDIYAFSNRVGDERSLIVYNNRNAPMRGWIRMSSPYSVKTGQGDERALIQRSLGEGLGLTPDPTQFCIFRDHRGGLEYLRNCKDLCEQGLYIDVGGYQYYVFLDFQIVTDSPDQPYAILAAYLAGRGVPSIKDARQELYVQPVLDPFHELVNAGLFRELLETRVVEPTENLDSALLDDVEDKIVALLVAMADFAQVRVESELTPEMVEIPESDHEVPITLIANTVRTRLEAILMLSTPDHPLLDAPEPVSDALREIQNGLADDPAVWGGLLGWAIVHALGAITEQDDWAEQSRSWIDEWMLGKVIVSTLQEMGVDSQTAGQTLSAIKLATSYQDLFAGGADERSDLLLASLLANSEVQQFLGINRYRSVLWFNKEAFDQMLFWMLLIAMINTTSSADLPDHAMLTARYTTVDQLRQAARSSGYQIERLRELVAEANAPDAETEQTPRRQRIKSRE